MKIERTYDVQVRMHSVKWETWVQRPALASARLAARQLRLMGFEQEPWWDRARVRLTGLTIRF